MTEDIKEEATNSIVDVAADTASDLLSGNPIPAPIKKSFLKAVGQLCTAAVDIPVSIWEGKATEKRAETAARVKIIETSASQIAEQMNVAPEYAQVAVEKFGQKIIKEQINLDDIVKIAANEIHESGEQLNEEAPEVEISDDWLNAFEKEASQKSSDDMKLLFGKILAGEIRKPSTFSIRTLKLLSQLDNKAAELFQCLCSLSTYLQLGSEIIDARVITVSGDPSQNSLQKYDLPFGALNILEEYGLIISDYNSYMNYRGAIVQSNTVSMPLKFQKNIYGLFPEQGTNSNQDLKIHGVALSSSGRELLSIVDPTPNPEYFLEVEKFFKTKNMNLVKIAT